MFADIAAGALRPADLGFADLGLFADYNAAGVHSISRWHAGWRWCAEDGPPCAPAEYLQRRPADAVDFAHRAALLVDERDDRRRGRCVAAASPSGRTRKPSRHT